MTPFDVLKTIYDVATTIHGVVSTVKANKAQCQRLLDRIEVIVRVVKHFEEKYNAQPHLPGLEMLSEHLIHCRAFVLEYTREDWALKVVDFGINRDRFAELNEGLNDAVIALQLAMGAEVLINLEDDKRDQGADLKDIKTKQEVIVGLCKELIQKQQREASVQEGRDRRNNLRDDERHHELTSQLDSIRLALEELQQPTPPAPVKENSLPKGFTIPYHQLRFTERLKQDAAGTLYLGTWGVQKVWIKTIEGIDERAHQQLRREMTIMSRVRGENLLPLYGACVENTRTCIVMECPENGFLSDLLKTQYELFTEAAKHQILTDVAKGLITLHQQEVIHAALTGEQIVLTETGRAKIAGFKFSHINTDSVEAPLSPQHSPHYSAPELRMRGSNADHTSDVYSYGILCWEMLTGKHISDVGNEAGVNTYAYIQKNMPDSVPAFYRQLIIDCCQNDSNLRPSLEEILKKLEAYVPSKVVVSIPAPATQVALTPAPSTDEIEQLYRKANDYQRNSKYQLAFELYQTAANAGHAKAISYLGLNYLHGNPYVAVNRKKAYQLLLRSAQLGLSRPDIEYNLGCLLESGDGVQKDLPAAVYWYRRAASYISDKPEFIAIIKMAQDKCRALFHVPTIKPAELIVESPVPAKQTFTTAP